MASIISAGTTSGTALNLTGDTSGNLAFQTAAGANTITVPNVTGTLLTNKTAGTVLQVSQSLTQTQTSTSSTSYVSTSVNGSITPSSASNKILVQVFLGTTYANASGATGIITIYRNSTTDLAPTTRGFVLATYTDNMPVSFSYLDSPSSTSSTTYTVYIKAGSSTFNIGGTNGGIAVSNSITLMEIAG